MVLTDGSSKVLGMQSALEAWYAWYEPIGVVYGAIVETQGFVLGIDSISKRMSIITCFLLVFLLIPHCIRRFCPGFLRVPLLKIAIRCFAPCLRRFKENPQPLKYQLGEEYLFARTLSRIPHDEVQSLGETHSQICLYSITARLNLITVEALLLLGKQSDRLLSSCHTTIEYFLWVRGVGLVRDDQKSFFLVYSQFIAIGSFLILWIILLCFHMVRAFFRGEFKSFVTRCVKGVHFSPDSTLACNVLTLISRVSNNLRNREKVLGESGKIGAPHFRLFLCLSPLFLIQPLAELIERQRGPDVFAPIDRQCSRDLLAWLVVVRVVLHLEDAIQIIPEFAQCLLDLLSLGTGLFENPSRGTYDDQLARHYEDRLKNCIVCYVSPRKVVVSPCGCLCLCVDCHKRLRTVRCVACQRPVNGHVCFAHLA